MSSSEDKGIEVKQRKMAENEGDERGVDDDFRIKKIVFDTSERLAVASFQSLGVPHSKKLSAAKADMFSIKDGVLTPPEENKMRNIMAMEIPLENGDNFRYEGSTPFESDDLYETWAAVVDPKTGEATLYPADVFHMMPRSNGYGDHPWRLRMDIPTNQSADEPPPKRTAAELREKNQRLTDSFGTTAKQRQKKQSAQNRLVPTGDATEMLEISNILTSTPEEKPIPSDQGKIAGDEFGILPPMNLAASNPREVIDLDDLVPPYILELIASLPEIQKIVDKDEAQLQEWTKLRTFPLWFFTALKTLSLDEERRRRQATLFFSAYIVHRLARAKSDEIRKRNAGFPDTWPPKLRYYFLDRFTQENTTAAGKRRVMPCVLKDKAMLHALYINLIANDFAFSAGEFFSELTGVKENRIQGLCNLGRLSRYSRQGALWIELSTPLPEFKDPKEGGGPQSRKRRKP